MQALAFLPHWVHCAETQSSWHRKRNWQRVSCSTLQKESKGIYFKWVEMWLTVISNPTGHQRSLLNPWKSRLTTYCVPFQGKSGDDLEVSLVPCCFQEADRIFIVWVQVCQFALAYHLPGYQEKFLKTRKKWSMFMVLRLASGAWVSSLKMARLRLRQARDQVQHVGELWAAFWSRFDHSLGTQYPPSTKERAGSPKTQELPNAHRFRFPDFFINQS